MAARRAASGWATTSPASMAPVPARNQTSASSSRTTDSVAERDEATATTATAEGAVASRVVTVTDAMARLPAASASAA